MEQHRSTADSWPAEEAQLRKGLIWQAEAKPLVQYFGMQGIVEVNSSFSVSISYWEINTEDQHCAADPLAALTASTPSSIRSGPPTLSIPRDRQLERGLVRNSLALQPVLRCNDGCICGARVPVPAKPAP